MKRNMIGVRRMDKTRNERKESNVVDVGYAIKKKKFKCAGHLIRRQNEKCAENATEWIP